MPNENALDFAEISRRMAERRATTSVTPEQDMDDEGVEFIESGPFPDTPVEIDELTPEDVAHVRGEVT